MSRRRCWFLVLGFLAPALILGSLWLGLEYYLEGCIVPGVRVHGQALGGTPVADAGVILEELAQQFERSPVKLYYGEKSWELLPEQLGIRVDRDAVLEAAYLVGREGNLLERVRERLHTWRRGKEVELTLVIDEEQRDRHLQDIARELNQRPKNASLDLDTLTIIPEREGLEVDQEASRQRLLAELKKPLPGAVPLVVRQIEPATTVEDLRALGKPEILGQATTVFDRAQENRTINIQVAAAALDGTLLGPGEVLSFNEVVGPREPEYGFVEAPELVNLELIPGYGGGVCQVASTLFHAALLAGMEVVERYNHSRPSTYIPLGLDAAVAYNYLDLKLANRGINPLLVVVRTSEDRIEVAILGKRLTPEEIRLEIGKIREIVPPVEEIPDPTLLPGEELEEQAGAPGYKVQVERVVTLAGREIRREVVSESYYVPRRRVVRVGPRGGRVHRS